MAATVFSAVIVALAAVPAVLWFPHWAIGSKDAQWVLVVPAILLPICYIYAPSLRERMPLSRARR